MPPFFLERVVEKDNMAAAYKRVIANKGALLQVLTPIFDPGFSDNRYGFRPGKSAHQAVLKAQEVIASGKRWVVDIDLEKFFDRVNCR